MRKKIKIKIIIESVCILILGFINSYVCVWICRNHDPLLRSLIMILISYILGRRLGILLSYLRDYKL